MRDRQILSSTSASMSRCGRTDSLPVDASAPRKLAEFVLQTPALFLVSLHRRPVGPGRESLRVIVVVRCAPLPLYFVPVRRISRESRALVFETQQVRAHCIEVGYCRLVFLFCLGEFGFRPVEPALQFT